MFLIRLIIVRIKLIVFKIIDKTSSSSLLILPFVDALAFFFSGLPFLDSGSLLSCAC